MAYTSLLTTIWTARLNASLKKNLVFANLMNRDYEVDARGAVAININTIGAVTVGTYLTGSMPLEDISSTSMSFDINQKKFFNFKVEDFVIAASNVAIVDGAMVEAGYALADGADQFCAALTASISGSATSNLTLGYLVGTNASGSAQSGSAYNLITTLAEELDIRNAPARGRFAVVPPWIIKYLNDDGKWLGGNYSVGDNGLVQGAVIAGLQLYVSNNLSKASYGAAERVIAGTPSAWGFASQINKLERYRPQDAFADAVKGLWVYGAKVLKPSGLVTANITKL